ncbi:MAG: Gfo/Idh/MocA family protein [Verrucomicrobiales bacterium]
MSKQIIVNPHSRRQFIRYGALLTGAFATAPYFLRAGESPNGKIGIGVIGAEGKGSSDADGVASENIVALCDIDKNRLASKAKKYPKAKLYTDYRKMLEQQKDIDAVTVSTPDHHHFPASLMAIDMKKHVYCQKPLTHSIWEARQLTEAARKNKVATLMGNQGHSGEGVRQFCELIWSGAIGDVKEVHIWTDRPIWAQGIAAPLPSEPTPDFVDWDLFIGPAPMRPYNKGYHPFAWRGWWDFGTGALGDMGCHLMDPANWALKLGAPTSVSAESEGNTEQCAPKASIVTYEFPARGNMPACKLVWYDGRKTPPAELLGLTNGQKVPDNGSLFIGSKGKVTCETYGANPQLTPDSDLKELPMVEKTLARSPGHYQEFIMACKGQKTPGMADFDYAGPFTEMVLLGNLAVRTGSKVKWDSKNLKADSAEANRYVKREYRKGWV